MPFMIMQHQVDPKELIHKEMGDISPVEVFNNQLLVAVYIRPEKTKSGILLPGQVRDEDKFQSKVGLVIKKGPSAFEDTNGEWFKGVDINVGDWIIMRSSDGWSITVNNVLCRMIEDVNVRGRIDHPDRVW
jgi:co-chaperonin GroES (HSP10)